MSIASAIRHRHRVIPSVLTIEVDTMPTPKASDMTVMESVKAARAPMKIRTEGLRARKDLLISHLRRAALEGDDALWPELDEQDHEQDHVGLGRQGVGRVQPFDPFLEKADHPGAG